MLTFILGTRPEALKILPLIREAKKRKKAFRVLATGQHSDLLLGTGVRPDVNLGIESTNNPHAYLGLLYFPLREKLHAAPQGTVIVVQGDTASALAAARAGTDMGIPVAHVEAGLRSHDLADPYPEEGFRVEIDRLATYHFCPTHGNRINLLNERVIGQQGQPPALENAKVVGNTITDALRLMKVTRETPKDYVLVTLHRRESFGEPLCNILRGLAKFAESHPDTAILWPLHPNPKVREALEAVPQPVNVLLRGPLPYEGFLTMLASAQAVLTDSGGVLEEATTLGVPTVCARKHTERPEAFSTKQNVLAGTKAESVEQALNAVFHTTGEPSTIFGDGHASEKILDALT